MGASERGNRYIALPFLFTLTGAVSAFYVYRQHNPRKAWFCLTAGFAMFAASLLVIDSQGYLSLAESCKTGGLASCLALEPSNVMGLAWIVSNALGLASDPVLDRYNL